MVRNLSYTLYRQQKRHPMVGLADLEDFLSDADEEPEEALIRQCEQRSTKCSPSCISPIATR